MTAVVSSIRGSEVRQPTKGDDSRLDSDVSNGDGDVSDGSGLEDQDDAQAVLQPAISAAASHLTSFQTPAADRVAALEKQPGGYFDSIPFEGDGDDDSPPAARPSESPTENNFSSSTGTTTTTREPRLAPEGLPSPWVARPRELVVTKPGAGTGSQRPSRSMLESAFGTTPSSQQSRQRRSGSAGQEALKRLQKALPSFHTPHLPSLASLSSFADRHMSSTNGRETQNRLVAAKRRAPPAPSRETQTIGHPRDDDDEPRPLALRRTTSDDSILYHSLSRASSLGDDGRFSDVREMVNIRFMAMKDSLPDVPRFRMPNMPSLPKVNGTSWRYSTHSGGSGSSPDASETQLHEKREDSPVQPAASTTSVEGEAVLDKVLEDLTGDIVVMGGYRGSILRSAEPPHQQLWAPVTVGLNIRKANLEVGLDDADEENAEQTIIPSGMLKHIGPIDIARKFIRKLRHCENAKTGRLRVWDFGYDWRLGPRLASKKLVAYLEALPSNQQPGEKTAKGALVVAHSLGGLITRHAVNQRPELFSGVLYAGTPQRAINILGPLRNGDAVLLNEKLLTAPVNFSIRTSFVFLPEDGFCFVDKHTGEEYPVDFYDPEAWVRAALSPCVGTVLPAAPRQRTSSLSSFLPNPLRARAGAGGGKVEKKAENAMTPTDANIAPQMTQQHEDAPSTSSPANPEQHARYMEYLTRTLAATRQFRAELAHRPAHQSANRYPPLAVLYGKSIPTVYAAQVDSRDAIARSDCYDDLLFRAGDGVTLAREAMLPEGYAVVKGGRVSTERGHITMLGDMPAMGRALEALVRGRRKGIGLGASSPSA